MGRFVNVTYGIIIVEIVSFFFSPHGFVFKLFEKPHATNLILLSHFMHALRCGIKVSAIDDIEANGYLFGALVCAIISDGPAFFAQSLHQFKYGMAVKFS